jgi:DNA repair protein RecN (Recombination protein N)
VNDTPVTLDALRKIGANLMDIHSQHDTLLLGDAVFQLNLLDLFAGLVPQRTQYSHAFRQYRKLEPTCKPWKAKPRRPARSLTTTASC